MYFRILIVADTWTEPMKQQQKQRLKSVDEVVIFFLFSNVILYMSRKSDFVAVLFGFSLSVAALLFVFGCFLSFIFVYIY